MAAISNTELNFAPDSYGSPESEPVVKTPSYSVPSSDYAPPAPPSTGYESAAADYGVGGPKPKQPKSKPTPGPIYYKPVETGAHEAGEYLYKPVETESAAAVASPTTSYVSSSITVTAGLCGLTM